VLLDRAGDPVEELLRDLSVRSPTVSGFPRMVTSGRPSFMTPEALLAVRPKSSRFSSGSSTTALLHDDR
jgi:hypothetical protein